MENIFDLNDIIHIILGSLCISLVVVIKKLVFSVKFRLDQNRFAWLERKRKENP